MPTFKTAREREAYHASFKDEDWRLKIEAIKAERTRNKRVSLADREQERINRILDTAPTITPMRYSSGERRDEPVKYIRPDKYVRKPHRQGVPGPTP